MSYVEHILEAAISRYFSYLDVGFIFDKYTLSRIQRLLDAYASGTLDSCSEKNEQKNAQNMVIEV